MKRSIVAVLLAALSATATAKGEGKDPFAVCKADFERLCKNVPPGEGRQVQCMISNKASLSGECAALVAKKEQHMQQQSQYKPQKDKKPQ